MKQLLFKPFEKFSALQLIVAGLIFTLLGTWLAIIFGGRFDGALDFHVVNSCVRGQAILDNIINISCLFVFLFIGGKIINQKTRMVDIFSTTLYARLPLYLLPLINFNNKLSLNGDPTDLNALQEYAINNMAYLVVIVIIAILFIIWYIALLYNGFKTASNAKGSKAIWIFSGALLFAEITSKLFIHFFN